MYCLIYVQTIVKVSNQCYFVDNYDEGNTSGSFQVLQCFDGSNLERNVPNCLRSNSVLIICYNGKTSNHLYWPHVAIEDANDHILNCLRLKWMHWTICNFLILIVKTELERVKDMLIVLDHYTCSNNHWHVIKTRHINAHSFSLCVNTRNGPFLQSIVLQSLLAIWSNYILVRV
jgi:hypothetical protein